MNDRLLRVGNCLLWHRKNEAKPLENTCKILKRDLILAQRSTNAAINANRVLPAWKKKNPKDKQ